MKDFDLFIFVEWISDTDLPWTSVCAWTADGDIAARVHQRGTLCLQPFHGLMRRPAFCHAAEVESHAFGQSNGSG